jgi:multidrug efflux pump subunit AcrA (membrane-fusion protein)
MFAPGARKRFRSLGTIVLLMAAMGGMLLSGCGGAGSGSTTSSLPPKTNSGTTAGAYTITVTATGNDAQNTLSKATFTLTVE